MAGEDGETGKNGNTDKADVHSQQKERTKRLKHTSAPISYKLYVLFLKYLVNREVPFENSQTKATPASASITAAAAESDSGAGSRDDSSFWTTATCTKVSFVTATPASTVVKPGSTPSEGLSLPSSLELNRNLQGGISSGNEAYGTTGDCNRSLGSSLNQTCLMEENSCGVATDNVIKDGMSASRGATATDVHRTMQRELKSSCMDSSNNIFAHLQQCVDQPSSSSSSGANTNPNLELAKFNVVVKDIDESANKFKLSKFLTLAERMYFKVNSVFDGKEIQVISLMSKKSNKEIAPKESFEQIVIAMHSQQSKVGQTHLSVSETIVEIRKVYTFGRRDFGMSEELVKKTVVKCEVTDCIALVQCPSTSLKKPASLPLIDTSTTVANAQPTLFVADKFYEEVAHVIIADELQSQLNRKSADDEAAIRNQINSIKRAGSSLHAFRAAKRKAEEDKNVQSPNAGKAKPSPAVNIVESMSVEEAYKCLAQLTTQMRKELLVMYAGERRHHDSLTRSIVAAQALVRRCQALSNVTSQK